MESSLPEFDEKTAGARIEYCAALSSHRVDQVFHCRSPSSRHSTDLTLAAKILYRLKLRFLGRVVRSPKVGRTILRA